MDLLTNEGRSWYQGVRFAAQHRTDAARRSRRPTHASKSEDRLNHWFAPENSTDPELDRGPTGADTPHNLVASATWNVPGSGPVLERLAPERRDRTARAARPYTIRYAGDPTGGGLTGGCSIRGCQSSQPGARNTARGDFINYADLTLARTFPVGDRQIEFRADVFNVFNNQNLLAGGYIALVGNPQVRPAHGRIATSSRAGSSSSRRRIGSEDATGATDATGLGRDGCSA